MRERQLQLGFGKVQGTITRSQRRAQRAAWWFNHMRQIVARATERPRNPFTHPGGS